MDNRTFVVALAAVALAAGLGGAYLAGYFDAVPEQATVGDTFYAKAPGFDNASAWLNGVGGLSEDNVTMVVFYSSACAHCVRTLDAMARLAGYYGVPVIGVHSDLYGFEEGMVVPTAKRFNFSFPIALDGDGSLAKSYKNLFLPHFYVVDARRNIRYAHVGEGEFDEAESRLRVVLNESGALDDKPLVYAGYSKSVFTGELLLGSAFGERPLGNDDYILSNGSARNYTIPFRMQPARVYVEGSWLTTDNYSAHLADDYGNAAVGFVGESFYLTADGNATLTVKVDGIPLNALTLGRHATLEGNESVLRVDAPGLYEAAVNLTPGVHIATIGTGEAVELYGASFG